MIRRLLNALNGSRTAINIADVHPWQMEIIDRVKPFTMTSRERLLASIGAVEYVVNADLPGAIVECGVWKGGQMMAMALTLLKLGVERELVLFDTFEGMTEPEQRDADHAGQAASALFEKLSRNPLGQRWCESSLDEVKRNLGSTGYPDHLTRYVVGPVEETIPSNAPEFISYLRLDTDWYASTKHELNHLYPRVVSRGIVAVDDYGHWQGARQATDEFLEERRARVFLHRVDYTCREFVKP